jgi:uncharacterized membrane-anchored protein YitT (DUF2179 family)
MAKIDRKITKGYIRDGFLITMGVFSAAFGFKGFLLSNKFIDGGATGISLLLTAVSDLPLAALIIIINAPFIMMGYSVIGKQFAIKMALAISALALVLATVSFPNVTDDKLLVALFGGFFLGAGIGFTIRGGAVIDGTEVLAIYLSKKFGTSIGDIIIVINILIFGAASRFLGIEIALYSMITYLAASRTLDFIVDGIEEYLGVTIISVKSEDIRKMVIKKMGRGSTIYKGRRSIGNTIETEEVDIVYTVITRLEINKINTEIKRIDLDAFVVMNPVKDVAGSMIKKRRTLMH